MNFWQFLDRDGAGVIIFVGSFFALASLVVLGIVEHITKHRERMAQIKAGKNDRQ